MTLRRPLSDDEKNELVVKYQNIVHYFGYKYSFFDTDIEEVKGWGFLGLAKAIHRFEESLEVELEKIIFSTIKKEIFQQHFKNRRPNSESSLQNIVGAGAAYETTLEQFVADNHGISFDLSDIRKIIEESLFEEEDLFRQINVDYLLTNKDEEEIAEEYNVSRAFVKRTHRRGQALIKSYLFTNEIILDFLTTPNETRKKDEKIINHKEIRSDDFGKVKYIRKVYSFLNENDIALLMDTSSYMISQLLDYPSVIYVQASIDDSIKSKVDRYCKRKYPERLPSKVNYINISQEA